MKTNIRLKSIQLTRVIIIQITHIRSNNYTDYSHSVQNKSGNNFNQDNNDEKEFKNFNNFDKDK